MAVSASADDVIKGAIAWALAIAADNSFHYGKKPNSQHNGCYFCGTNTLKGGRAKKGVLDYEKSYCCNPFVHAAFAHGGGEPTMLKICKKGSSYDYHKGKGYDTSKLFVKVSKNNLKPGDVLCNNIHVMLYIGDGKIVEASGGDDNKRNSKKWNNSIRVRSKKSFDRAYRYIGVGGGEMMVLSGGTAEVTGTDTGAGIEMKDAISRLYSSQNFERIQEQEDENLARMSKFRDDLKETLSRFQPSSTETNIITTAAYPEAPVTSVITATDFEKEKPKKILKGKATNLASYPTLVEAPTIVLDFNGVKIGGYGNSGDKYPNYLSSMSVSKINGRINQYEINLVYQIRPGEDPNFIDKLISRVGYMNPLKILYGDSNASSYYREESAIITDAKHNEDVSGYKINYKITAVSSITVAQTSLTTFKEKTEKPSSAIYDLLYNSGEISKGLLDLFPGMKNQSEVARYNLIPTTDSVVNIGGMNNVSSLTYLSHLVSCMESNTNLASSFYLSIVDNSLSKLNGSYFKIDEIVNLNNSDGTNLNSNYFELDIGYPTNNYITNFQLCNNNYWSLVYDYTGSIPKFEYGIDDMGNLIQRKTNALYASNKYGRASLVSSNWWKQVTEFPISAKVTLKGLTSPVLLMSYVKVNALFYGQRDMASGLYVVTKQVDSVSANGCSTELTLLRVAGDL